MYKNQKLNLNWIYNIFRISAVKSNILKNDEKIARMVGSIGVAGK